MQTFEVWITNNWISIAGALIGLLYLFLEYKASIWMWLASIAMAAFYIFIFYNTQLYASMAIYIYFFIASIYGWIVWLVRKDKVEGGYTISRMPKRQTVDVILAIIGVFTVIFLILHQFSPNQGYIALGDALTTALNIVALWMMSRKWAEQWLLLIPANLVSAILLFAQHDVMSGFLFVIFFVVSIFGYFKWLKMADA